MAATALLPAALAAQSGKTTFDAGVADAQTGAPIIGAEVVLPELRIVRRTDALGHAVVPDVPAGTHRVRVRLLGYAPADVRLEFTGDTTGAVFRLERAVVRLGSIDVTADAVPGGLKDFESRRRQGIGRFLTERDLSRDADRDFMTMATLRFPGLEVATDADGRSHLATTRSSCGATAPNGGGNRGVDHIGGRPSRSGAGAGGADGSGGEMSGSCASTRPCLVQVYLDDIKLDEAIDTLIRTWDLSGAEYYTGASMPARYRTSGSACGVVLLWSRWR